MFEDEKQVEEISKWSRQQARGTREAREELGTMIRKLRIAEEEKSKAEETEL